MLTDSTDLAHEHRHSLRPRCFTELGSKSLQRIKFQGECLDLISTDYQLTPGALVEWFIKMVIGKKKKKLL